jgi:threonine synthase
MRVASAIRDRRPSGAVLPTTLVCAGCGYVVGPDEPLRLACPAARPGDDIDHVLRRDLDTSSLAFPRGTEPNPFLRYRTLFHGYHVARSRGLTDADVVGLVERLDRSVAAVDGRGFRVTPLVASAGLDARIGLTAPGGVLIKDETGHVAGSHKARHLFGTLLELELGGADRDKPLAIASCGNAALAAGVVAKAAGRRLRVFIPMDAPASIVERLHELGADIDVCERTAGVPGDPTYRRLREAIHDGAIPFTCQGNQNGLAIEGGLTLGYELVDQLRHVGRRLDRLFVQVGGGALASSIAQALSEAERMGAVDRPPRLLAVQTLGAYPLKRAYDLVVTRLVERFSLDVPADDEGLAGLLQRVVGTPVARDELAWIARHRSRFMWPWESQPNSVASGILDDETYDWLAVVRGMLRSGGYPLVADEETLVEANELARSTTAIDVDTTGSAGLAGLLALWRSGTVGADETIGLLFTGIRREPAPGGPPVTGERP